MPKDIEPKTNNNQNNSIVDNLEENIESPLYQELTLAKTKSKKHS